MKTRAIAAELIKEVLVDNKPFDSNHPLISSMAKESASQTRYYCFSVLRHFFWLESLARLLLHKPLKKKDYDVYALILIGLFELWQKANPEYAIVNETGKALSKKKKWAQGLVNATLRQFQRDADTLIKKASLPPQARYNCPLWLLQIIKTQWPTQAEDILHDSQTHPPMTLRVNHQHTGNEEYCNLLQQHNIKAQTHPFSAQSVLLEHPIDVHQLPGFTEGKVSVQDLSAQLAPALLELAPHMRVLDACAAPGGKCAHLLELEPSITMHALELNPSRCKKLESTLNRLRLSAKTITGDGRTPKTWWDGELYDRILLDAPCSGSGVMRRHPDMKLRSTIESVQNAVHLQKELLDALWPLLKHNGILVYITCSIFQDENVDQINQFLANHPDCQAASMNVEWGLPQSVGQQILPDPIMDGFYYAKLVKN